MDWDSAVQKELYRLKMELKKKNREIVTLKTELSLERDRAYRIERLYKKKERKEREILEKEEVEKKREEMIKKETIL